MPCNIVEKCSLINNNRTVKVINEFLTTWVFPLVPLIVAKKRRVVTVFEYLKKTCTNSFT